MDRDSLAKEKKHQELTNNFNDINNIIINSSDEDNV